jgi:2-oxoglutarate ferredoxin oxidoreductase subunit alpha
VGDPILLQGNSACARGAIAAGCRLYAGYPISPSSEVAEEMASALPRVGGVFVQMEDEIASLAAVIGASVAGVKAMTATSGPGFSLMQEHIGYAAMAEVPCVIVDVMRGGPSTGLPTSPSQGDVMQARWGTHGDHPAIVLAPGSVREIFDLTVRAFHLSERFRMPVIVAYDEVLGHVRERVTMPENVEIAERRAPDGLSSEPFAPYAAGPDDVSPMASFGDGHRFHMTGLGHDEHGYPTNDPAKIDALIRRLHRKIDEHLEELEDVERFLLDDADIVVFAYGIVASAARDAVVTARSRGIRAGLLRPRTLWPFPEAAVRDVAARVRTLVVAELNLGQMSRVVAAAAAGAAEVVGHFRVDGEPILPDELVDRLEALVQVGGVRT